MRLNQTSAVRGCCDPADPAVSELNQHRENNVAQGKLIRRCVGFMQTCTAAQYKHTDKYALGEDDFFREHSSALASV